MVDLSGFDFTASEFFTIGIDVYSAGAARVYAHHMNVENERFIGLGFEPVHVVFDIGYGGTTARTEITVDGWRDNHVVGFVFKAIVVPTMKLAFQDQERCRHIVVTMGNDGATLLQCKDLVSEDKFSRQSCDFRKRGPQAHFTALDRLDVLGQFFKVNEFQQVLQIDGRVKFFNFFLPLQRLKLFALEVQAPGIQVGQPHRGERFQFFRKCVAREERFQQRPSQERTEGLLMKITS